MFVALHRMFQLPPCLPNDVLRDEIEWRAPKPMRLTTVQWRELRRRFRKLEIKIAASEAKFREVFGTEEIY